MTDLKYIEISYTPPDIVTIIKGETIKEVFDRSAEFLANHKE
jgi:hypothetical protein